MAPAEATPAQAAAYIDTCVARAKPLLPWIATAADGAAPPALAGSFDDTVIKPLETLVGRAYNRMWVTEEQAPAARLAAQLAAQGLAAGLPPADTADPGMQDSLLKLCRMLSKKGHWDLLDLLVAGPCASLFATEAGVMDLVDLGTDTQGRLRLTKALPALAERCAAQGRVEGVAALLVFAEEGGCINVTELAQTVCATLDNAAGTIYLSNLKKDRQERLCDAICKHAAGEHAACLLAVLKSLPQSQLDARRVVAQALVKAARLQCADLLTDMHSFYGDLSALLEEVQRQLQPGLPVAPNPGGWALPDDIVQHFQCDRSPPGQHCRLCQPLVAFMRGTRLETLPALRFEEGALQDNLDHLESMLGAFERRCALETYLEKAVFTVDSKAVQGKGKKSGPKPQVAAVRLRKLDAWYTDKEAAHRGLMQAAHVLQTMLALAPVPAAATASAASPAEATAAAVTQTARPPAAAQQQQAAVQKRVSVQPAAAAGKAVQQQQAAVQPTAAAAAKAVQQRRSVVQPTAAAGTQAAQKRHSAAQPAAVQPAGAAATRTVQQQQAAVQPRTTAATTAVLVRRKAAQPAAAAPKAVPKQQAGVQAVAPAETAAVVQEQSAVEAVPAQQAQQAQQAGTAAAAEVTERVHAAAPATCAADQPAPVHEAPAEAQPAVKVPAAEPAPAMDATAEAVAALAEPEAAAEAAAAVVEPAEAAVAAVTAQGIEAVEVDAAVEGAAEVAAAAEEPAVAAEAAATAQGIEAMEVDAAVAVAAEAAAAAATAEPEAATEAAAAAPAEIEAMEAEGQLEQAAPAAAGPAEAAPAASAAAAEPDAVPAASAAAATPGAPAAAAQLLVAEDSSVLGATQGTPAASRSLVQRTLLSNGSLSRMPPPEQGASQGKLAGRRLSLGPQSTAKSAASGSTGRKRPAAGSTAKKGGGPGSRTRALLARDAQRLRLVGRLPMLYEWFKTENQHLSEAECSSLATSKLAPRRLDWQEAGQEVDSEAVQAPAAAAASAAAAGPAAERGKRSRRG